MSSAASSNEATIAKPTAALVPTAILRRPQPLPHPCVSHAPNQQAVSQQQQQQQQQEQPRETAAPVPLYLPTAPPLIQRPVEITYTKPLTGVHPVMCMECCGYRARIGHHVLYCDSCLTQVYWCVTCGQIEPKEIRKLRREQNLQPNWYQCISCAASQLHHGPK